MSRLCRLGLLVVSVAVVGMPAPSEAGAIPLLVNSMFGQVGIYPFSPGYSPYYGGYSNYYGGPYSGGYAGAGGYTGAGCRSCQPSYSYPPCGCSPCVGNCGTGCASGNCATGACATTTNSAPSGTLAPVPDPTNSARSIESRLEVIEKALHITPPPAKTRTYEDNEDKFNSVRGRENEAPIPSRPRGGSTGDAFDLPIQGGAGGTDDGGLFKENPRSRDGAGTTESLKPPLPGDDGKNETVIPAKKPAPALPIDDKGTPTDNKGTTTEEQPKSQALRLENRITSRAVSPRERQAISVGFAKPAAVASKKTAPKSRVVAPPQPINVARH